MKHDLLSNKPPELSKSSGADESSERVAAVTLSLENCSCSQATYSRQQLHTSANKCNMENMEAKAEIFRKKSSSNQKEVSNKVETEQDKVCIQLKFPTL